jgi:uncharacterized protein YciI
MAIFVVTMVHGPNYDDARSLREQDAWDAHAEFMDALVEDGFVILGGPLGGGERAMLVVEADDLDEIEARMAPDPWKPAGILEIGSVQPWSIWLDGSARLASLL